MKNIKLLLAVSLFTILINTTVFAQQTGSISGQVEDSFGAVVIGATVIAVDSAGTEKSTTTNRDGAFTFTGLAPGNYIVRVVAENFAFFENPEVEVKAGERQQVAVAL